MSAGFLGALSGIELVGSLFKVNSESQAEQTQLQNVQLQEEQSTLQYQQKSLSNYDKILYTLSANRAAQGATGTGFDSPSFGAIQRSAYNTSAREQKNLDIEHTIQGDVFNQDRQAIKDQFKTSVIGDFLNLATTVGGFAYAYGTQKGWFK